MSVFPVHKQWIILVDANIPIKQLPSHITTSIQQTQAATRSLSSVEISDDEMSAIPKGKF